jgi:hypothetical protein
VTASFPGCRQYLLVYYPATNEVIVLRTLRQIPPSLIVLPLLLAPGAAWAQEGKRSSPPGAGLRITAPRPLNGRGEWLPSEIERGFLSTTPITCAAEASDPAESGRIRWRAVVFRGSKAVGAITGSGPTFTFRPADAGRRQPSGPLAVEIVAELAAEPEEAPAAEDSTTMLVSAGEKPAPAPRAAERVRIQQDEIDQLRQEYLDLPGRKVGLVPRHAFIDRSAYEQSGALSIPWPELNRTRRPGGGEYGFILFTDALREGLRRWQEALAPRPLTITSGFRNPHKQRITNGRASGSMHQYGRAVDVQASIKKDYRDWVQVAWAALDAGADYVETAPEGGWNHVHADWRNDGQGPPLTVKVEITGRVVDGEGNPAPAARVLGASDAAGGLPGMPAWEGPDENGRFLLRTAWRTGRAYRLRAATGQSSGTVVVTIPESASGLVTLETELVLTPDTVRQALAKRRALRIASRGGRYRRASSYRRRVR